MRPQQPVFPLTIYVQRRLTFDVQLYVQTSQFTFNSFRLQASSFKPRCTHIIGRGLLRRHNVSTSGEQDVADTSIEMCSSETPRHKVRCCPVIDRLPHYLIFILQPSSRTVPSWQGPMRRHVLLTSGKLGHDIEVGTLGSAELRSCGAQGVYLRCRLLLLRLTYWQTRSRTRVGV